MSESEKREREKSIKDDEEINSIDNLTKNESVVNGYKINMWDGRATTIFPHFLNFYSSLALSLVLSHNRLLSLDIRSMVYAWQHFYIMYPPLLPLLAVIVQNYL